MRKQVVYKLILALLRHVPFGNTPSSGSLQVVLAEFMNNDTIQYSNASL